MWVDTYDYVRLHQPHPFFTAGNIAWTIDKPPEYLADKGEVLDHLQHCLDEIKTKITVVELFGHELESHDEVDDTVRVVCRGADGQSRHRRRRPADQGRRPVHRDEPCAGAEQPRGPLGLTRLLRHA